jgi:pyrimidine deaminase RibD-like protein
VTKTGACNIVLRPNGGRLIVDASRQDLEAWMHAAIELARPALGRVWPNPAVGCLLVHGKAILAEGVTQPGGRPHAESVALESAGAHAVGALAVVSLEPCAHHGVTPPCAGSLIRAGVSGVIFACEDPDPRVKGRGLIQLRDAGIEVITGILEDEAKALNAGFFSRVERGRPWMVKTSVSAALDPFDAIAFSVPPNRAPRDAYQQFIDVRRSAWTAMRPVELVHTLGRMGLNRVAVLAEDPLSNKLEAAELIDEVVFR